MKLVSFCFLSFSLFLFACGGGGSSVSAITNDVADTATTADAVSSSPWSSESVVTPTTAQKTTASNNVQTLISTLIATQDQSSKTGKTATTTKTINKSEVGPKGGTATVTGSSKITTTLVAIYPVTTETTATLNFDGYVGESFSLHGETEYSGSSTVTNSTSFETTFTTHGGYSYKDSNGVYSLNTQMDVSLKVVNSVYSGTYTFVVNGETITGTF